MAKQSKITSTEEGTVLVVQKSDEYKKANYLIGAKYQSTLLENRVLALSLSKIDELKSETIDVNGKKTEVLTSEIRSAELKQALKISSSNLSHQLGDIYQKMASRQIGFQDENGNFGYRSLFIGGDYSNGSLKLYYNPLLTPYYQEVSKSYTILSLATMLSFRSNHSFRLYELLKKECFTDKAHKNVKVDKVLYEIEYLLSELKLSLGVVNADEQAVRNILQRKGSAKPDYDEAVRRASEKGFERWIDFKKRCIEPAVKEINNATDMNITYDVLKAGQGGKVYAIKFLVSFENEIKAEENDSKDVSAPKIVLSDDEKFDFILELKESLAQYDLKTKDLTTIAEKSGWNMQKCSKAIECLKANGSEIANVTGWLIKAVIDEYEIPAKKEKKSGNKSGFKNFNEREYDFSEFFDMIDD